MRFRSRFCRPLVQSIEMDKMAGVYIKRTKKKNDSLSLARLLYTASWSGSNRVNTQAAWDPGYCSSTVVAAWNTQTTPWTRSRGDGEATHYITPTFQPYWRRSSFCNGVILKKLLCSRSFRYSIRRVNTKKSQYPVNTFTFFNSLSFSRYVASIRSVSNLLSANLFSASISSRVFSLSVWIEPEISPIVRSSTFSKAKRVSLSIVFYR